MGAASAPPTRSCGHPGRSFLPLPFESDPLVGHCFDGQCDQPASVGCCLAASPATGGFRLNHGLSTAPQARSASLRVSCVSICPVWHVCVADICTVCRKLLLTRPCVARLPQTGGRGRQPREVHRSRRAPRGCTEHVTHWSFLRPAPLYSFSDAIIAWSRKACTSTLNGD